MGEEFTTQVHNIKPTTAKEGLGGSALLYCLRSSYVSLLFFLGNVDILIQDDIMESEQNQTKVAIPIIMLYITVLPVCNQVLVF